MTMGWPVEADCMGLSADDAMFKLSHQYGLRQGHYQPCTCYARKVPPVLEGNYMS